MIFLIPSRIGKCVRLVFLVLLHSADSCSETAKAFDAKNAISDWTFCSENCLEFNHSKWQLVLDTALDPSTNFLRYANVPRDELQAYLNQLCSPDISAGRYSSKELWAILANAYNALILHAILRYDIKESIIKPFGNDIWKLPAGVVGGFQVSLDNVEHNLMRVLWEEPRVHAALVCGAKSCPPLRTEPYTGSRLEEQLQDQMRTWLADPNKGLRYDQAAHAVHLSKIFRWYFSDFAQDNQGLLAYLAPYVKPDVAEQLTKQPPPAVHFFGYDWTLNEVDYVPVAKAYVGTISLLPALGLGFMLF